MQLVSMARLGSQLPATFLAQGAALLAGLTIAAIFGSLEAGTMTQQDMLANSTTSGSLTLRRKPGHG